jgi:hypothetical protein
MKAILICPGVRPAVPHLAEPGPLAIVPILGQPLVAHWIEYLAALGARHLRLIAPDRADEVAGAVGDGARWGVQIEVISAAFEPTPAEAAARYGPVDDPAWMFAPHASVAMSHLPGCPAFPLFESYAAWFAALLAWVPQALTPTRVRMREARPGIWVGGRARVSATAQLIAPCWIGDQVFVEPHAVIGPGAILEDRSVVEKHAHVEQSWVGPDTFVGPMTSVSHSLAWGERLINWRTDSSLRVPDPFLLCSLARRRPEPRPVVVQHAERRGVSWVEAWRASPAAKDGELSG